MDALFFNAGIHGIVAPQISASSNGDLRFGDKPSVSAAQTRSSPWGFTFRHPLRSLWPGGKSRYEPAIATDDTVLVEEKECVDVEENGEGARGENWVLKILHVKSLWKEGESDAVEEMGVNLEGDGGNDLEVEIDECGGCLVDDEEEEKIKFDRKSFSRLLRKVPLAEARLYAKMSYLGCLAYSIPEIKPGDLRRKHGLRMVTSSIEKREQAMKVEEEKLSTEEGNGETNSAAAENNDDDSKDGKTEQSEGPEEKINGNRISASAAYQIAASAASYLHCQTRSLFRFKSTSSADENFAEQIEGIDGDMINQDVVSLMATTDSVTAVVAAKEEVKQAVADDLNSTHSSPCEWFICDDDHSATRLFVIQGSESLASWQANLLFEPIQFEGLDVLVHRGIYEAAKGIYEQMLPEIRGHLESHGDRATFRFTGHSLGGSLSLLINLMLLIREEVPRSSLLPTITFGAPSIMCGGDRLLHKLRLPRSHVRSIIMHRDIVPRAFSCNYPNHVAKFLKAINRNFRNLPCLDKQKLLYAPMGELLILQPDNKFSPFHDLLPPGSGLYVLTGAETDIAMAEKEIQAAQSAFLSSPHPLEILSDRSSYGSEGTIQRDHDMDSYVMSIRNVIRQELSRKRKAQRERRRKVWWPLGVSRGASAGVIFSRPVSTSNVMAEGQLNFSSMVQTGTQSLKRFTRLIASQHMHLLVIVLFPARSMVLGAFSLIKFH